MVVVLLCGNVPIGGSIMEGKKKHFDGYNPTSSEPPPPHPQMWTMFFFTVPIMTYIMK